MLPGVEDASWFLYKHEFKYRIILEGFVSLDC